MRERKEGAEARLPRASSAWGRRDTLMTYSLSSDRIKSSMPSSDVNVLNLGHPVTRSTPTRALHRRRRRLRRRLRRRNAGAWMLRAHAPRSCKLFYFATNAEFDPIFSFATTVGSGGYRSVRCSASSPGISCLAMRLRAKLLLDSTCASPLAMRSADSGSIQIPSSRSDTRI